MKSQRYEKSTLCNKNNENCKSIGEREKERKGGREGIEIHK